MCKVDMKKRKVVMTDKGHVIIQDKKARDD